MKNSSKMRRPVMYLIICCLGILQLAACAQNQSNKGKEMIQELLNVKHYEQRPEYRLQVSGMNCSWEIEVNEMPLDNYFGDQGGTSSDLPLNTRILKSGKQFVKLKVYPLKGQSVMNIYATLRLVLVRYADNKNYDGAKQELVNYALTTEAVKNKPYFEYQFAFDADVPYTQVGWSNGKDLTKEPDIEKKVFAKMDALQQIIKDRNTDAYFKEELQKRKDRYECFYATDSSIAEDLKEDNLNEVFKGQSDIHFTANTAGSIVFYDHNKVVSVKQWVDPVFVLGLAYKATEKTPDDYKGWVQFLFYMPEGTNELKVIR